MKQRQVTPSEVDSIEMILVIVEYPCYNFVFFLHLGLRFFHAALSPLHFRPFFALLGAKLQRAITDNGEDGFG